MLEATKRLTKRRKSGTARSRSAIRSPREQTQSEKVQPKKVARAAPRRAHSPSPTEPGDSPVELPASPAALAAPTGDAEAEAEASPLALREPAAPSDELPELAAPAPGTPQQAVANRLAEAFFRGAEIFLYVSGLTSLFSLLTLFFLFKSILWI